MLTILLGPEFSFSVEEVDKSEASTSNRANWKSLMTPTSIKHTKEEWSEARSQREGLPYYKNQSMKAHLSDYRN